MRIRIIEKLAQDSTFLYIWGFFRGDGVGSDVRVRLIAGAKAAGCQARERTAVFSPGDDVRGPASSRVFVYVICEVKVKK